MFGRLIPLLILSIFPALEGHEVELIDSPEHHRIEILMARPTQENGSLLLFLHGAGGKGLRGLSDEWFDHWLAKGYKVAAISMPGYGGSTGRKDFCGPSTIATLNFAMDHIKQKMDTKDFGIIGFGQGSLAGTLLTTQRSDIRCLVCSNGGYDLLRHKDTNDALMQTIVEKQYAFDVHNEEELKARSPLFLISNIHTPIFMLHRKGNPVIPDAEAIDFYQAALNAGLSCVLVIKEKTAADDAQKMSFDEVLTESEDWVDAKMR